VFVRLPLNQQRAQMERLPHVGDRLLPRRSLSLGHKLPDGQRCLQRPLRQLVQRLRQSKGHHKRRRGALQ
jgi:hypothetical protein